MPKRLATDCVHAGEEKHGIKGALSTEIAQTSVFVLPGIAELRKFAAGKSDAYIYSRYGNPTITAAEQKIAALEGAEGCVVTSSGMSATLVATLALCSAGDEIVSMLDIYGGTHRLFEQVLSRLGITTKFVSYADLKNISRFFSRRTRMLLLESPTNPTLRIADLAALSAIAHKHKVQVVVDNTFATPILQQPLALGADVVYHSATKYLGGHSDLTAGAVLGFADFIARARDIMIITGANLDPLAAFLLIRGLKTLHLRVERACANAALIAAFLASHPRVARVFYPGLPGAPGRDIATRQMRDFGMMLSFDVKGGGVAAEKFVDRLRLWYLATSFGGVESTVSYPVLSSHLSASPARLKLLGISAATLRLSVGIEDSRDLIADLKQALK